MMVWVWFLCVFIINYVPLINSSGIFELRLVSFVNDLNRDVTGNCCSGYKTSELCSEKCQTFFRVCLKHYQTNIDPSSSCTFGEVITPLYNNTDNQLAIQFQFNFSWPETFSLIIEAWHKHDPSSSWTSEVSTSQPKTRTLISRLAVSRYLKVDNKWTHKVYSTNYSTLTYSYRVTCKEHYFGEHCGDLCKPRDDKFGHFICGPNGEKICHPGWHGSYCEKAICREGCNATNGECEQPNECNCRRGWEGHNCDQCSKYPGCQHGYCIKPWECLCKEGWGGLLCNLDLNYCTNHKPCKNGGLCTNTGQGLYTCECPPGFTGRNCDVEMDSCSHQPCLNAGTCKTLSSNNYTCECPLGYSGRHCETMASTCINNPCSNEGTCIDGPSGVLCVCKSGYFGPKCEYKDLELVTSLIYIPKPQINDDNSVYISDNDNNNNNNNNNYIQLDPESNSTTTTTSNDPSDQVTSLSSQQIVLVIFVALIVPLMVLIAVIIIFIIKHRKHHLEKIKRKDDAEARRQNEQNSASVKHQSIINNKNKCFNSSMNNINSNYISSTKITNSSKCISSSNKCLDNIGDANVIVNALDRPPSLYHLNHHHNHNNHNNHNNHHFHHNQLNHSQNYASHQQSKLTKNEDYQSLYTCINCKY